MLDCFQYFTILFAKDKCINFTAHSSVVHDQAQITIHSAVVWRKGLDYIRHTLSKIIFSQKSLSVHIFVRLSVCPSRPIPSPSPKKVIETENFAKQSCQIHYKGDKNTSRVMLPPPLPLPPPLLNATAALLLSLKPLHFLARRS